VKNPRQPLKLGGVDLVLCFLVIIMHLVFFSSLRVFHISIFSLCKLLEHYHVSLV
jgi:hypothetical protein